MIEWNLIEYVLLAVCFFFQLYVCREVIIKTNLISTFFPDKKGINLTKALVANERFEQDDNEEVKAKKYTRILSIANFKKANSLLKEVVESLNDYLRNNKGNAADFHLLKNIVDRHLDTIDEEISHLLPVPLYLGLAATMLGIIFGLLSIGGDVNTDDFVKSISSVISSIKYAMICSLVGLIITTCLSAVVYRKAKSKMETQKNNLLDLLQTQLLPHLNEDAVATLMNLQANLKAFNDDFEEHIEGFSGIMDDVHKAFDSQVAMVKELKRMDMVKMSGLNVSVLNKLNQSMAEFEKFTQYLNSMNSFVSSAMHITKTVDSQLERTGEITALVKGFRENIDKNQIVMDNLQSFMLRIDENKALALAAQNIDASVVTTLEQMKKYVEDETSKLKNYTSKATQELETLMQREKGQLDKLKSLERLDELVVAIKEMASDSKTINVTLAKRIASLTESINDSPVYGGNNTTLPRWLAYVVAAFVIATCGLVIFHLLF